MQCLPRVLGLGALLAATACGTPTGPATASLAAVSPAPGATAVSPATPITMTFGQPMMAGMEQYLDLHQGGVTGPVVPMTCGWSPDRTVVTCTPGSPLAAGTQYTIHAGAGMSDADGHPVGMGEWTGMGGHWASAPMLGGMHAGQPVGMMGAGWTHAGHYGMLFSFTTG